MSTEQAQRGIRIGIDLGGTKTEGLALGPRGDELIRHRVSTPKDYEDSLRMLCDLVGLLERKVGAAGTVGIGIPGAISPDTGLVKNANSTWLNGQPLRKDIEEWLDRPVRVMNDANCFALSEASDGAGAGERIVFGVILGTGVGGGLVVGGECLIGPNLIAGEWGHNPLPWPASEEVVGPACYCGKHGCIETYLSGPGFERDHERQTGTRLSSREIIRAAAEGDPGAVQSLRRYHDRLARGLASVINLVDPNAIVLGGGMSNIPELAGAVEAILPRYVFSDSVRTSIRRNVHGDSSGVRGAAWLWSPAEAIG